MLPTPTHTPPDDADYPAADLRPEGPPGYRVLDCWAEPKHPGLYMVDDDPEADRYYHPPCFYCTEAESRRHAAEHTHQHHHRPFLRSKLGRWLVRHAYPLGIIAGSTWGYGGPAGCNGCVTIRWRGRRPYILGVHREEWACILRRRHWPTKDKIAFGMCTRCLPCDVCGSKDAWHRCEAG